MQEGDLVSPFLWTDIEPTSTSKNFIDWINTNSEFLFRFCFRFQ